MNYDAMANEEARYQENTKPMQGVTDNSPKKDVSNIERDLNELKSCAEYLHMRLDTHEKKLYPVLRGDYADPGMASDSEREHSSHLDSALRDLLSNLQLVSDRVATLTERLDI